MSHKNTFSKIFSQGSAYHHEKAKLLALAYPLKQIVKRARALDEKAVRSGKTVKFLNIRINRLDHDFLYDKDQESDWPSISFSTYDSFNNFCEVERYTHTLNYKLKALYIENLRKPFTNIILPRKILYTGRDKDDAVRLKENWGDVVYIEYEYEEVEKYTKINKLFDA